jgi:hypothetical protein
MEQGRLLAEGVLNMPQVNKLCGAFGELAAMAIIG